MRVALWSLLCLLVCAVPALAGGAPDVPAEWEGIWSVTTMFEFPCGGPAETSTSTDTLCAGQTTFDPMDDSIEYSCSGTADATSVDMTCTGSVSEGGCTTDYLYELDGTRTGDTFSTTATITVTANDPTACGFDSFCIEINQTGERIGGAEVCEKIPVETRSWGVIKSEYR